MSILKSIMHHWNKTTNSYDTLHPETESAQITDWHSGIMASLASTTLGTVVSAVTTDSVLGKLIKMLLNASGVKYLIDTNGYICFGEFFGGLIIQWGSQDSDAREFYFPLAFNACYGIITTGWFNLVERKELTNTRFAYEIYVDSFSDTNSKAGLFFVAIGK